MCLPDRKVQACFHLDDFSTASHILSLKDKTHVNVQEVKQMRRKTVTVPVVRFAYICVMLDTVEFRFNLEWRF